ncbi:MAG: amidohydrolase, partial [Gammaproteobacteria bacterium]|nr:amidohydrolase [Gammaproteobacteria bacterium]
PLGRFAIRAGPVMACEDNFEITLKGVGSHAAMPHMGVDPLVCGAEIVTALQTVVARTMNPSENSVISVTEFITDGTRNVIPGQVTLRGDTRSFLPEIQDHIEGKMRRIVEGVCAAHGVQGEFHYSHEFVPTINSEREAQIAYDVAQELMGAENVDKNFPPAMTSEDFGFMLQHKPGCYILIGNGGDGPGGCGLHNPGFDFNDDNLTIGADYWVRLVESQLTN